jgi:hypothetical protein
MSGADSKTMPVTRDYEDGYERTFGKGSRERGRWVWDDAQQKLVRAEEYVAPQTEQALHAPVLAGRFYENTRATDGTDIGTRKRHREYMRRNNLTTADDFSKTWAKEAAQRKALAESARSGKPIGMDRRARREEVGRAVYELERKSRK